MRRRKIAANCDQNLARSSALVRRSLPAGSCHAELVPNLDTITGCFTDVLAKPESTIERSTGLRILPLYMEYGCGQGHVALGKRILMVHTVHMGYRLYLRQSKVRFRGCANDNAWRCPLWCPNQGHLPSLKVTYRTKDLTQNVLLG